jgi:L-fuculose-phosphate aldolase
MRNIPKNLFTQFRDFGRDLFLRGMISSHAGNMSVRNGRTIYITRKGSMLGRLKEGDIVGLDMDADDPELLSIASSEVPVHNAIYANTGSQAVIHAHPPYATLLSMTESYLAPVDWEGSYFFRKIPVLNTKKTGNREDAARTVGRSMEGHKVVLMRSHGSFARGDTLEEAYMLTSSLEASAFFIYHLQHPIPARTQK